MLGQHSVGHERALAVQLSFRHHALSFAEQVGQLAGVGHGDRFLGVGDDEVDAVRPAA